MVSMRDGVQLATDVYRLDGEAPASVLLTRTPYDKEHTVSGSTTFDILRAVQAGYTVVIQDVRGRFASEGAFNPHFQESHDGADTIAWVAAQPWSCGVVGGFGGSYLGCTQKYCTICAGSCSRSFRKNCSDALPVAKRCPMPERHSS